MANNEKKFKISFDAESAKKAIQSLKDGINKVGSNIKDAIQKPLETASRIGGKALDGIGKAGSVAFKGIGTAIKGAGIGLLISLLATLWEALKKNQKIMDLVSNAINAMGIFIKPLVDGISSMVYKFKENNELLEKMKIIIGNLLTIAITPLKLSFYAIKAAIQGAMLAWESSFLGGKDPEKIKQLTADLKDTKDSMIEVGTAAVDAGKEFAANIGDVVTSVAKVVSETVKEVKTAYKNLSIDAATAQAAAMTQAKKNLDILAKQQEEITKKAETAAEKQRQIRDDETLSYEERLKASQELAEILNKQQLDEELNIKKQIENQQLLNSLDTENEEGKNALLDLNNKLLDVESRITTQKSEQLSANRGLIKSEEERLAAAKKLAEETAKKTAEDKAKNEIDIAKNTLDKINENEFASYKDKQAALEEYYKKIKELAELNGEDLKLIEQDTTQAKKDLYNSELELRSAQAKEGLNFIQSLDENLTETKKNILDRQLKNGKINQDQYDKQLEAVEKKAFNRKKSYSIANAIIDTAGSILKTGNQLGYPLAIPFQIAAGILGASQIAMIASQQFQGSSAGAGASTISTSGTEPTTTAPSTSFSFGEIDKKQETTPVIKTYVISKDVETQSQLDRQIVQNGTM